MLQSEVLIFHDSTIFKKKAWDLFWLYFTHGKFCEIWICCLGKRKKSCLGDWELKNTDGNHGKSKSDKETRGLVYFYPLLFRSNSYWMKLNLSTLSHHTKHLKSESTSTKNEVDGLKNKILRTLNLGKFTNKRGAI